MTEARVADAKQQKGIGSVETAMILLRIIEQSNPMLSLSAIAKAANFAPSKTHHYLVSLVRCGLVKQDAETGYYGLGPYALQLGMSALDKTEITPVAVDTLRNLSAQTGETAFFAVWSERGPVVVQWVGGHHNVTVSVRVGTLLPLWNSPTGDVFMTWLPQQELQAALEMVRQRDHHPSAEELKVIRKRAQRLGLAHASATRSPTVAAVSVPVFGHDRRLAGALTALGLVGEFDDRPEGAVANALLHHADMMSRTLGWRPAMHSSPESVVSNWLTPPPHKPSE